MEKIRLEKILACPKCKKPQVPKRGNFKCTNCAFVGKFENGIWELLYIRDKGTKKSQDAYDKMHRIVFEGPRDGSYEILGAIAKGNKTVDIASGDGFIEHFAPETVAVEFSKNALLNAKKLGAKHLVLADAHNLPFIDNAFEISISSGNLEQFTNPKRAVSEMVRISKIQILTVHREFDFPFAPLIRSIFAKLVNLIDQPIEKPQRLKETEKMLTNAGAKIIYRGDWTLPLNLGRVVKFLPEFTNIPACFFIISIKNDQPKQK